MALYYSDENKTLHKVSGNINLPTNVERVEVVYDKTSDDPNINWGYKTGLPTKSTVTGKDFSKYKYLKIYVYISGAAGVYYVDLTQKQTTKYLGLNIFSFGYESSSTNYLFKSACYVAADKTSIELYTEIVWLTDGHTYSSPDAYYVYKIEGVY